MRLKFAWYSINRKIFVHQVEVAGLDLFEHVVALLANKSIIVLAFHMDNELFIAAFCALRKRHYLLESDGPLKDYKAK